MSADERDRLARAYLLNARAPGDPAVAEMVAAHGPVAAAELVSSGSVWEADAVLCTGWAKRHGLRLVVPGDAEWPAAELDSVGLWVTGRGHLGELAARSVGIAGTGSLTPYGTQVAARLAVGLARSGRTVVSLGRVGIDGAALRGSMRRMGTSDWDAHRWNLVDGPAVEALAGEPAAALVLPLGWLTEPAPSVHAGLFRRVGWDGLLISEHGTRPPGPGAVDRHRQALLMASLISALVLVEPGWGSRWLIDAAQTAGVPVLAVPGPISSEQSRGAHELIASGRAELVDSVRDILARLDGVCR